MCVTGQAGTLTESCAGDDGVMGHPQIDAVISRIHADCLVH